MNWYHHPQLIDRLAGEYALGTMTGAARRRFETVMRQRPELAAAVRRWHGSLAPGLIPAEPVALDPARWEALQQRLFAQPHDAAAPVRVPWWKRLLMPVPAGALALGLMLGVLVGPLWESMQQQTLLTQLPESYVGVLATADGRPGLIVSSLRHGRTVDLKRLAPVDLPPGHTLYLWSIDQAGVLEPVAPLPSGAFVSVELPAVAETVFARAIELAVSVEPVGATPSEPGSAFVYRGLCGKLWVPPPAPTR